MKKLLIISLFLVSLLTLFADGPGVPHHAVFDLQTADGGYHEAGTIGFMAEEFHPNPASDDVFFAEEGSRNQLYWNWPDHEDQNTALTSYAPGETVQPGRIAIQMATLYTWGIGGVQARFWFIDDAGNQTEAINLAKGPGAVTIYPEVIAWGGFEAPSLPEWAINPTPETGAMGVAIDMDLTWAYDGEVIPDGYEIVINDAEPVDLGDVLTYTPEVDFAYATLYTWGVIPYVNDAEPARGLRAARSKIYPEGDMPEWTFTTIAEPVTTPSLATLVSPEDGAEDVAIDEQLMWTYEGAYIDGFEVVFNGADAVDVLVPAEEVETYSFDPGLLATSTEYSWSVRPYREPANLIRGMKTTRSRVYPSELVPNWIFTTTNEVDVSVGETEIVIVVPDGGSANAPIPGELNPGDQIGDNTVPAGLVYVRFTIDQLPGAYTFRFTLNYASVVVLINNIPYNDYTYTGGVLSLNYAFTGAKAPIDLIVYDESTLPVELSSFTAVAFASEYVTLNWVTESESNLHGYNIFRAENNNLSSAMRINSSVVVANNQAVTSTYTYRDNEVESTTYYYWLEVSELSNENTFHGPIVVTVEDDPVIPGVATTEFGNFGPSPFSDVTSTTLRVKEGETASITIYNLLGQVIKRETFNAGEHNFTFNGRDANGKRVANGIYFVKMASPTTTKNFKIVKMK